LSNIVPWQLLAERVGARINVVPVFDDGTLDVETARRLLNNRVKLFAFTHISNALGTINPVAELCALAKAQGIPTLIDGSQAAPHMAVDVQAIGCDFYACTGHKMFGPTGTGILWGKRTHLESMPPFLGGGEMIEHVSFAGTTFNTLPNKFEAGTPNIAGFIGLSAAVKSMRDIGIDQITQIEAELALYADESLRHVPGVRLLGPTIDHRAPVFSFVMDGAHAHDLAMLLDQDGIAIRSGQHCAHPLMQRLGISATARVSLAFYNTKAEIDALVQSLKKARQMLI
jgi:cysteine desulfurase / selenocysteine lyase